MNRWRRCRLRQTAPRLRPIRHLPRRCPIGRRSVHSPRRTPTLPMRCIARRRPAPRKLSAWTHRNVPTTNRTNPRLVHSRRSNRSQCRARSALFYGHSHRPTTSPRSHRSEPLHLPRHRSLPTNDGVGQKNPRHLRRAILCRYRHAKQLPRCAKRHTSSSNSLARRTPHPTLCRRSFHRRRRIHAPHLRRRILPLQTRAYRSKCRSLAPCSRRTRNLIRLRPLRKMDDIAMNLSIFLDLSVAFDDTQVLVVVFCLSTRR